MAQELLYLHRMQEEAYVSVLSKALNKWKKFPWIRSTCMAWINSFFVFFVVLIPTIVTKDSFTANHISNSCSSRKLFSTRTNHVWSAVLFVSSYLIHLVFMILDFTKPELIIRESQPIELPSDVVRGICTLWPAWNTFLTISVVLQQVKHLAGAWMNLVIWILSRDSLFSKENKWKKRLTSGRITSMLNGPRVSFRD